MLEGTAAVVAALDAAEQKARVSSHPRIELREPAFAYMRRRRARGAIDESPARQAVTSSARRRYIPGVPRYAMFKAEIGTGSALIPAQGDAGYRSHCGDFAAAIVGRPSAESRPPIRKS